MCVRCVLDTDHLRGKGKQMTQVTSRKCGKRDAHIPHTWEPQPGSASVYCNGEATVTKRFTRDQFTSDDSFDAAVRMERVRHPELYEDQPDAKIALLDARFAIVAGQVAMQRVEVLHGYTSQETAYMQPDYPYGRLRCRRRVWLEKATKGSRRGEFRLMTQTDNPKVDGEAWNKPHASTYATWAVLIRKPDQGADYLDWTGCGIWGPDPAEDVKVRVSGVYAQLDETERKLYDVLLKMSHKGNSTGWQRWHDTIVPAMIAYYQAHESFPAAHEATKVLGFYLGAHEHASACAAALLAIDGIQLD